MGLSTDEITRVAFEILHISTPNNEGNNTSSSSVDPNYQCPQSMWACLMVTITIRSDARPKDEEKLNSGSIGSSDRVDWTVCHPQKRCDRYFGFDCTVVKS